LIRDASHGEKDVFKRFGLAGDVVFLLKTATLLSAEAKHLFMPPSFVIIGSSHIAKESVRQVKESFLREKPDLIAIELDRNRLDALLSGQKPDYSLKHIKTLGLHGYLFALIGGMLQRKLGKMVGMEPGAEMKQAALLARSNNLPLLLMDRDVRITLQRLSKRLTRKEKWRLAGDLLFGWLPGRRVKVRIDLSKVPEEEFIATLMEQLKGRYPTFYTILVEERNHIMAQRLLTFLQANPDKKVLAVMGAGHARAVRELVDRSLETKPS
jgi:pheromone shutdown-related protein TraB